LCCYELSYFLYWHTASKTDTKVIENYFKAEARVISSYTIIWTKQLQTDTRGKQPDSAATAPPSKPKKQRNVQSRQAKREQDESNLGFAFTQFRKLRELKGFKTDPEFYF
jgi:hypothetical protein